MINLLRKNQRGLMLVIATLTIIAFIFLYNTSQLDQLAGTRNAKIYGQTLTPGAIDRQVKNYQLTLALGQYDLLAKLGGTAADQSAALTDYVWNLLVLQHQARAMGVQPTDSQVAARIKSLPVFQTGGQFDPQKYSTFLSEQLAPRGFTERQLEEVMRDALRVERIAAIVEAPAAVGDVEIRDAARVLQPVTGGWIRFDADPAAVKLDPAEVAAYFERNRASLNSSETRVVRYVVFELPGGAKLEGRAKVEEMQKLTDAAIKFADSLGSTTLADAATGAGLQVRTSPAFDRTGNTGGKAEQHLAEIAPAAFLLSAVGKTTDVIQSGDALCVAELAELNPVRPLTLEEATPAIEARLRQVMAEDAVKAAAGEKIASLRKALESGQTFEAAAKAAGVTVQPLDKVVPMDEKLTPEQRRVIIPTLALKDGELSGFEPAPWGGFSVYLQSRGPLADADLAGRRDEILSGLLENKRSLLFAEWLRVCRDEAQIVSPRNPRG